MLNTRSIQGVVIFIVGIVIALWLGVAIVTNQLETLIKVGAVGLLLICLFLGNRIWIIVPIMSSFGVLIIRGFSTAELGQVLFIGFALMLFLMRRLSARWTWGEMDWWALLLAVMIIQVYLRNPVGINMFGSSVVGGKPYFMVGLAFVTMIFYGNMIVKPQDLKWVMWISVGMALISGPAKMLRGEFGTTGSAEESYGDKPIDPRAAGRVNFLNPLATVPAKLLSSFISPLKACFHPLWVLVLLFTMAAAAMSGYRNTVALVGLIYLAGIAYHSGGKGMIISGLLGVVALGALSGLNLVHPLPPNVQRALSPFPGTWEERYVRQAESSTEWRVEMWKEALLTDHWIENKWLGDGLGMSRLELARSKSLQEGAFRHNISGLSVHQENAMIDGNYHSGPVQTIRTVGYVGLVILFLAQIRLATRAHRLLMRCKGTAWYHVALFYMIPLIIQPIYFTFIFGDFRGGAVGLFLGLAGYKLLDNNLPVPAYEPKARPVHVPLGVRGRQQHAT